MDNNIDPSTAVIIHACFSPLAMSIRDTKKTVLHSHNQVIYTRFSTHKGESSSVYKNGNNQFMKRKSYELILDLNARYTAVCLFI